MENQTTTPPHLQPLGLLPDTGKPASNELTTDQKIQLLQAAIQYSIQTNDSLYQPKERAGLIKKSYKELCAFILEPVS